jgi:hypothetical protein
MFHKHQLRVLVLCLGMELAAFMGVPVRADEIEDLLRNARREQIECSVREDDDEP